jgi:hypothetical protein
VLDCLRNSKRKRAASHPLRYDVWCMAQVQKCSRTGGVHLNLTSTVEVWHVSQFVHNAAMQGPHSRLDVNRTDNRQRRRRREPQSRACAGPRNRHHSSTEQHQDRPTRRPPIVLALGGALFDGTCSRPCVPVPTVRPLTRARTARRKRASTPTKLLASIRVQGPRVLFSLPIRLARQIGLLLRAPANIGDLPSLSEPSVLCTAMPIAEV